MMREPKYIGVTNYRACLWLHFGKYVVRIGKLWGHPYHYAHKPYISAFRCWR